MSPRTNPEPNFALVHTPEDPILPPNNTSHETHVAGAHEAPHQSSANAAPNNAMVRPHGTQ